MPVTKSELPGFPKETWTRTGFQATRQFECAWTDREALKAELQGSPYTPIADTGSICTKVSSAPFQAEISEAPAGIAAYEKALVAGEWTVQQGETVGLEQVSESIEPNAEFLTLPHRWFAWGAADGPGLAKEEAPGILWKGFDYVLTKFGVATVPIGIRQLVGDVNAAMVTPLTGGLTTMTFAAETLLFTPPTIIRVVDEDGNLKWDITYRLSYKPNFDGATARGWNWFFRMETGTFVQIYLKGGAIYKPYPTGDFTIL